MRAATLALVLATAATLSAGCGGSDPAAAEPVATTRVLLPTSYKFEPAAITVAPGATVTWKNEDNFTHTVRFEDGPDRDTHELEPGDSVSLSLGGPGTYDYVCTLHPHDMTGRVVVR